MPPFVDRAECLRPLSEISLKIGHENRRRINQGLADTLGTASDKEVQTMRLRTIFLLVAMLCSSCSSRDVRNSPHDWLGINWDFQNHVLESREAWDSATGRHHEYQGGGSQLVQ